MNFLNVCVWYIYQIFESCQTGRPNDLNMGAFNTMSTHRVRHSSLLAPCTKDLRTWDSEGWLLGTGGVVLGGFSFLLVGQAETLAVKLGRCAPSLPLAFLRPTLRQMPSIARKLARTNICRRSPFWNLFLGGLMRSVRASITSPNRI